MLPERAEHVRGTGFRTAQRDLQGRGIEQLARRFRDGIRGRGAKLDELGVVVWRAMREDIDLELARATRDADLVRKRLREGAATSALDIRTGEAGRAELRELGRDHARGLCGRIGIELSLHQELAVARVELDRDLGGRARDERQAQPRSRWRGAAPRPPLVWPGPP